MAGLLSIDNLDDRREIIYLLGKLRPAVRWQWLQWVARLAKTASGNAAVAVTFTAADHFYLREAVAGIENADTWVTNSAYWNAFQLATQYRLPFEKLVLCLEQLVKGIVTPEDLHRAR